MIVLPRKLPMLLPAALLVLAAGVVGWDFFQLGRKVPEQVPPENRADLIKVDKAARTLTLLHGSDVLSATRFRSVRPLTDTNRRKAMVEHLRDGIWWIQNGRSRFHLALHISYPNAEDRERARQRGVSPGRDIMIHGFPMD